MEVDAVSNNLSLDNQDLYAQEYPDSSDIEGFTQAMFGNMNKTPEEIAISALQSHSLNVGESIESARATAGIMNNPKDMLHAQSLLLHTIAEMDFTAKVVGALSQGINKLASMQ